MANRLIVIFRPEPGWGDAPLICRCRKLLKIALRACGMRAEEVRELPQEPTAETNPAAEAARLSVQEDV